MEILRRLPSIKRYCRKRRPAEVSQPEPLPAPAMPVPNPAGVPNTHAPKLPANVPPELQQLIPSRDSMQPRTRGMIQRSPRTNEGSAGGTDAAAKQ